MHARTPKKQHLSKQDEEARIAELESEFATLLAELGLCSDEDAEKIVKSHIRLLHEYNEAKDAAQILIGRLAVRKETTVRQLHEGYGLGPDD